MVDKKWLAALWKREWNYWEKLLVRHLKMEVFFLVAVFVLFTVNKSFAGRFSSYLMSAPDAVLAFWGFSGRSAVGNPYLFMRWAMMFLHAWIAWEACSLSVRVVWREEEEGSIYTLCNQWYDRYQIGIAKYTWSVVNYIISYAVVFAAYMGLLALGSTGGIGVADELAHAIRWLLKGMLVITMLVCVCCCHAMLHVRKDRLLWADGLVLGTLAVGNLYKLVDLAALWLRRTGRDAAGILKGLGWLRGLRWLSPLSWLNPFAEYGKAETLFQVILCIMVIVVATVLGLLGYRVRKFS